MENGFYASQLYFPKIKNFEEFYLSRISYNPYKNWEELRISGKIVKKDSKTWELTANFCTIFSQKYLHGRWYLINTFDCDHLNYTLKVHKKGKIMLSPGIMFESNTTFNSTGIEENSGDAFFIIKLEEEKAYAWGKKARYISRKDKASKITKEEVLENRNSVLMPIDTIVVIDNSKNNLQVGDKVFIPKRSFPGFFD